MTAPDRKLTSSQAIATGDAEAIRHFEQAIGSGRHWFIALLESMGLWTSSEEAYDGRTYRYLIGGEAFDWLLLAERLCEAVDGLLPADEKNELLFSARPPLSLNASEVEKIISESKYHQYLNYFYGVTVEDFLLLAVQEEVYKERFMSGSSEQTATGEAFRRIYGEGKDALLKRFRRGKGYPFTRSIGLTEQKEFTYWLFKYRVNECEKAKVASDTRKALRYLQKQRSGRRFWGALVAGEH